jgi:antitoxin ParD1/3/4
MNLGEHLISLLPLSLKKDGMALLRRVVRAGLRLLETEEEKLEALRRLIDEGRKSGTVEYNYESFMAELDKDFT